MAQWVASHMDMEPSEPSNETPSARREKPRVPAAQILPSDRHPFSVHFDVVRRFVTLSHNGNQPIEADRVVGEGVPVQAGSLNVRFFKSVGLLTTADRGLYLPTQEAIRFVTARSVSDEKARPILRSLIESSWFATTARLVLAGTKPISEEQFLGELALAAQTDKSKKEPALRVILEYLVYSGIVHRDESGLTLANGDQATLELTPVTTPQNAPPSTSHAPAAIVAAHAEPTPVGWHTIQTEDFSVSIKSDLAALDDLSAYLQTLRQKVERLQRAKDAAGKQEPAATGSTES